jgi:hypothetical protein
MDRPKNDAETKHLTHGLLKERLRKRPTDDNRHILKEYESTDLKRESIQMRST